MRVSRAASRLIGLIAQTVMISTVSVLVVAILLFLSLILVFRETDSPSLRYLISPQIVTGQGLDGHASPGFGSGAWHGLFELDDDTALKIEEDGLAFFDNIVSAKNPKWDYREWEAIPPGQFRGKNGCALTFLGERKNIKHRRIQARQRAAVGARTEVTYATRVHGGACIMVLPKARLVHTVWLD